MRSVALSKWLTIGGLLLAAAGVSVAQGPPGGVPPGQAKKQGYDNMPPGQAKKYDNGEHGMPPGQAKKYDNGGHGMPPGQAKKYADFRFHQDDRSRFYSHYRSDADRWRGHKRPHFVQGEYIPQTYVVRPVPHSYWAGSPPPPPGYQYGYYDGYVVAYNPATRIIADVLDLVSVAATTR